MDTLKSIWNYFGGKDTSVRQIGQKPPNTNYQQPRKENFLLVNMETYKNEPFEGMSEEIQERERMQRFLKNTGKITQQFSLDEWGQSGMINPNVLDDNEYKNLLKEKKFVEKTIESVKN